MCGSEDNSIYIWDLNKKEVSFASAAVLTKLLHVQCLPVQSLSACCMSSLHRSVCCSKAICAIPQLLPSKFSLHKSVCCHTCSWTYALLMCTQQAWPMLSKAACRWHSCTTPGFCNIASLQSDSWQCHLGRQYSYRRKSVDCAGYAADNRGLLHLHCDHVLSSL